MGTSVAAPTRAQSLHLQINPSMIERLRQITKKNILPTPKPNGNKLPLRTGKVNEDSLEKNTSTSAPADSSDFIISSAGSSPAHSPQPMDFEVLSTPPRSSKPKSTDFEVLATPPRSSKPRPTDFEVLSTPPRTTKPNEIETNRAVTTKAAHSSIDDRQKACSRLVKRFEESSSKRTLSNGVCTDSKTLEQDSSSIEVLEEGDQTPRVDSTAKTAHAVNGEVSSPATRKDLLLSSPKEQNSPALSDLAPTANAEETRGFSLNSEDFQDVRRSFITLSVSSLCCCLLSAVHCSMAGFHVIVGV